MTLRKKILLSVAALVAVVLLGLTIAVAVVYRRAMATPDHWRVVNLAEPTVARDAEAFEQWLSAEMTEARGDRTTWRIEIAAEDVNNWLATRLPISAANQGFELPGWLSHPMVAFADQRAIAAAEVARDGRSHIVSAAYEPIAGGDDQPVAMELKAIYVGKQRIADDLNGLIDLIETFVEVDRFDRGQLEELREQLQRIELAGDLGDGREVQVVALTFEADHLVLTCRTRRAPR